MGLKEKQKQSEVLTAIVLPQDYEAAKKVINGDGLVAFTTSECPNVALKVWQYRDLVMLHGRNEVSCAMLTLENYKQKDANKFSDKSDYERLKDCFLYGHHQIVRNGELVLKYGFQPTPPQAMHHKPIEIKLSAEQQELIDKAIAGEISVEYMFDRVGAIAEARRQEERKRKSVRHAEGYTEAMEDIERIKHNRMAVSS
jgi:hypothetical protein